MGNRSLVANVDRICQEINRQPFDVDKIMDTAREIRRTLVEAEENAKNAIEQYLIEKETSFERAQELARSAPNRVSSAYANRSRPDESINQTFGAIVSFHRALNNAIINLHKKGRKTPEESEAQDILQRAEELENQIIVIDTNIEQLKDELNRKVQSAQESPLASYGLNDPLSGSDLQTDRMQSKQRPVNQKQAVRNKNVYIERIKREYKQKISEQQKGIEQLQRKKRNLQPQIQRSESVISEYQSRKEQIAEQVNQLEMGRVNTTGRLLWLTMLLFKSFFCLQGRLTKWYVQSNIRPPKRLDEEMSKFSVPMIGFMRFPMSSYRFLVYIVESKLSKVPSLPDIDTSSLEDARMYTENSLEWIEEITRELKEAQNELKTAHEKLQNARNKERLIELATEHTDRIRPFREYSDTLVRLCEGIIIQQNKPRTNKPRHTELYKIRLCALALAESDRQILPGGTPSPEWESTKLQVGTAYNVTPLCLKLFFYLVILEERMTKELPATEGIRIVRERR
jgi:hypothetical protein